MTESFYASIKTATAFCAAEPPKETACEAHLSFRAFVISDPLHTGVSHLFLLLGMTNSCTR